MIAARSVPSMPQYATLPGMRPSPASIVSPRQQSQQPRVYLSGSGAASPRLIGAGAASSPRLNQVMARTVPPAVTSARSPQIQSPNASLRMVNGSPPTAVSEASSFHAERIRQPQASLTKGASSSSTSQLQSCPSPTKVVSSPSTAQPQSCSTTLASSPSTGTSPRATLGVEGARVATPPAPSTAASVPIASKADSSPDSRVRIPTSGASVLCMSPKEGVPVSSPGSSVCVPSLGRPPSLPARIVDPPSLAVAAVTAPVVPNNVFTSPPRPNIDASSSTSAPQVTYAVAPAVASTMTALPQEIGSSSPVRPGIPTQVVRADSPTRTRVKTVTFVADAMERSPTKSRSETMMAGTASLGVRKGRAVSFRPSITEVVEFRRNSEERSHLFTEDWWQKIGSARSSVTSGRSSVTSVSSELNEVAAILGGFGGTRSSVQLTCTTPMAYNRPIGSISFEVGSVSLPVPVESMGMIGTQTVNLPQSAPAVSGGPLLLPIMARR